MELVVAILVVALLAMMIVPATQRARQKSLRIHCLNNFMQIGTSDRLWAGGHGDRTPFQTSITNGGLSEILPRSNAGPYCWKYYAAMASELGQSPSLLLCPADERHAASNFTTDFKDNTHLSYFVGVNASDIYPQSIAGGDRNLGPGTVPDPNYGYSPANGNGNDVIISGPVCWSLKMHSGGNAAGAGNILCGDGSAQAVSSASFGQNWLRNAPTGTNVSGTNQAGTRLVFP